MRKIALLVFALIYATFAPAQEKEVNITILQTSDIHGAIFPFDFINSKPMGGSLARVSSIVKSTRKTNPNTILLDNGDALQGQPTVYYYNFIDTVSRHLYLRVVDYMKYDAVSVGNHDIETGHAVYDRIIAQNRAPMLAANAVRTDNGEPYFEPYTIIERDGIKVAVIGLITPGIPKWLPEAIWSGIRFDDMVESAQKWMKVVQEKEHPHVIIGLFHAGHNYEYEGENEHTYQNENGSLLVAQQVAGFDAILIGHDHDHYMETIINNAGSPLLILDPSNGGRYLSEVNVSLTLKNGKLISKEVSGQLIDVNTAEVDPMFMEHFANDYERIEDFVSQNVGSLTQAISSRPAFFGPSEFIDLIHRMQLSITGADISITAPLSFDTEIKEGDIFVRDMFKLYKYENLLYTMELTGKEVDGLLEHSYGIWANQMANSNDHLLLLRTDESTRNGKLQNPHYNFDSAAGISYTVDVTKPVGNRVTIATMYDGTPFQPEKTYTVAINSYRGNGGGDHLTKGAGIPKEELSKRIISSTDKDLRYYLMQWIIRQKMVNPTLLHSNEWKFIPEEWTIPAANRDYELLFGSQQQ